MTNRKKNIPIKLLETSRLILRPMQVEDAPFVFELLNSPLWLQNIGDRGIHTLEDAKKQIEEKYLPGYINGLGNFLVIEKKTGKFIGSCGLYQRDNLEHPDIGFAFLPAFIGKGFGWEAASALKKYAHDTLKLSTIFGVTLPKNISSCKLLEKLGLQIIGTYQFENDSDELLLYST